MTNTNQINLDQLDQLKQQAEEGNAEAQFCLGLFYFLGTSEIQSEHYIKIGERCIAFRFANCFLSAAFIAAVSNNFEDCDFSKAFQWFERAAIQNHVEAHEWLALLYRDGLGIEKNYELAYTNILYAVENGGSAEAQYQLAFCYLDAKGTEKNPQQGIEWCRKAAEQDNPKAMYLLACSYFEGDGVAKDFLKGLEWLNKVQQNEEIKPNLSIEGEDKGSIIENRIMLMLALAYANGGEVEQNDALALHWYEKLTKTSSDKALIGEASFQVATYYFDGKGTITDFDKGFQYLSQAMQCHHAGAIQCFENAYLQFTFPEFMGRDDVEQCYQYAYSWLVNAYEENPTDPEVNFGLGVLSLTGKGCDKSIEGTFVYLNKFDSGHGIDHRDDYDNNPMFDMANLFLYKSECYCNSELLRFFASENQVNAKRKGEYIVCPSLIMDFYLRNGEIDLLMDYVLLIRDSPKVFEQPSTHKQFVQIMLQLVERDEELSTKNESLNLVIEQKQVLEIKMQKLVEQFTHTLGNVIFPDTIYQVAERLKTNPECRKDVLLLNEAYHSEIIIKLQAELLRQRYANTNPEVFRQMIRKCRRKPNAGDKTKSIAEILDYAASRVAARFLNQHNASLESIRTKILAQKNVNLESLRQKFEDDILLNKTQSSLEWISQNLRPFKVIEVSPLWQKVFILAESHAEALLFGYFSEVLFNAFKYADHTADEFLTVVFDEAVIDGITYLTCNWRNPLGDNVPNSLGTGKGLEAIQEDLKQLNDTESYSKSMEFVHSKHEFQVTMFFQKDLLIKSAPSLKFPR